MCFTYKETLSIFRLDIYISCGEPSPLEADSCVQSCTLTRISVIAMTGRFCLMPVRNMCGYTKARAAEK
jgi:hypothetical protein